MPSLLSLPRELRDEIIELVLSSQVALPLGTTCERYHLGQMMPHYPEWLVVDIPFFFPNTEAACSPPGLGLLRTNKQLRSETIDRIENAGIPLTLDMAMLDSNWVWPAWRTLPPRISTTVQDLNINIILVRTDNTRDIGKSQVAISWEYANTVTAVLGLVCRLLDEGSAGLLLPRSRPLKLDVQVSRLKFNLTTLSEDSKEAIPLHDVAFMGHLPHDQLYAPTKESLKTVGKIFVTRCEQIVGADARPWSANIRKCVRQIVLCEDGVICEEIDVPDQADRNVG